MRAFHGAGAARRDHRAFDGPGCGVLRAARIEADLECGGCVELCAAGHGASDARVRPGQDRGRHRRPAGAQRRAAEAAGRNRAHAGGRRSGGRGPRQGAGAGRRDGRLGLDDYRGDEEHSGGGCVVRSGQRAAQLAAARAAYGRIAPLRARRGLQRLRDGQRAGGEADPCSPAAVAEGELVDVVVPAVAARTADRPPIALSVAQVQRHLGATLDDAARPICADGELVAAIPHRAGLRADIGRYSAATALP